MKVLCIGDSNTYGYDPRSYFGSRYPAEVRWTGRLEGHEVINCGMNGLAVPYDSRPFAEMIRAKAPDLAVVMLGSNDLLDHAARRVGTGESAHRRIGKASAAVQGPGRETGLLFCGCRRLGRGAAL